MQLRSLALQGFKSFVQRTTLDFDRGITAIVGPNGSGKSNLADAFRWTMGEQSLRALRGRRTEDVLFAGGQGRPPAGFAEVALTFDAATPNGRGPLDLPFAEVSVARRAYRSGENEYYLNRDRVRLRDISDVFGQVGLDLDGFAVVGQGTVDAALSLRASDRRALVEQAAGTGYLQNRLEESQTRLEQTRLNLSRVADLLAELGPRLRALERQAKLVQERDTIQIEYWNLAARWYAHLLATPLKQIPTIAARLSVAEAAHVEAQRALEQNRDESVAVERAIVERERALAASLEELTRLRDASTRLLRELASDENALTVLRLRRGELEAGREQWRRSLEDEQSAAADLVTQLTDAKSAIAKLDADLAGHARELESWTQRRQSLEERQAACRRRLTQAERQLATAVAGIQATDDGLAQLGAAVERRAGRRASLAEELRRASDDERARRDHVADAEKEKEAVERRARDGMTVLANARERHERDQERHRRQERELGALKAKVDALESIENSGSAFFPGVRAIVRATSGRSDVKLTGIVGVVSRLIEVSPRLELAIEVGLGGHAQDVVVEKWTDAEAAITYLKSSNLGRATFLPLDALRGPRTSTAPSGPGILGIAAALVEFDPKIAAVAALVLGQTLIVDDLAVAKRVLDRVSGGWQIVTVDGELARTSGSVTGGAPPSNHGMLAKYRELRDARRLLAELAEAEAEAARRLAQTAQDVRREVNRAAEVKDLLDVAERALRQSKANVAAAEGTRQRLHDQVAWEDKEAEATLAELTRLRRRRDEQAIVAEAARRDREAAESELRLADDALAAFARGGENVANLVRSLETERGNLGQRVSLLETALDRATSRCRGISQRLDETRLQLERIDVEEARTEERLAPARSTIVLTETQTRATEAAAAGLRGELTERRAEREAIAASRAQAENAAAVARDEIQDAQKRLDRLANETAGVRQQVTLELGPLDPLDDSVNLSILLPNATKRDQPIEELADPEKTRERLATLRSRLKALPTDPDILAEYDASRTRVEALSAQYSDLSRTATTLNEAIAEIRNTIESRFELTFTAISEQFARRFADLFGGGTARLIVEPSGDVAGVDIFAQPPGKRTQSLATLSGGERALTASALLFSLIETNPPPFCVLDEVDASLDESNVARFTGCLRELSERTQFVVITHNRRTMEAARAIYGLTLEDKCETRLLSLRLPEGKTPDRPVTA